MTYTDEGKDMKGLSTGRALIILMLGGCLLSGACSKPPPEPMEEAVPAKVVEGTSLSADPNPVVSDGSGLGETTIRWSTKASRTELRIDSPAGKLFADGGPKGTAHTGKWVNNGMKFYLQNKDAANPTSADATLGVLSVTVQ